MMSLHVIIRVEEEPVAADAARRQRHRRAGRTRGHQEGRRMKLRCRRLRLRRRRREVTKLIVGLATGQRIRILDTTGSKSCEELARRYRVKLRTTQAKGSGCEDREIADGVLVAQPTTFMNLSGWAFAMLPRSPVARRICLCRRYAVCHSAGYVSADGGSAADTTWLKSSFRSSALLSSRIANRRRKAAGRAQESRVVPFDVEEKAKIGAANRKVSRCCRVVSPGKISWRL